MPIRTHRGRAAVYRRLWGWPLRSPKHLVLALVIVGATATGIGLLLPEPPPNQSRAASERATASRDYDDVPSGSAPRTRPAPPSFSVPQAPPPLAPPDPAGLAVVEAWGRQWANHPPGTNKQEWLGRLRPYTTDEFLTVMDAIDPANVLATAVTGPPTALESTASSMEVRLPTDAGELRVSVIKTPLQWRVAQYDKVG